MGGGGASKKTLHPRLVHFLSAYQAILFRPDPCSTAINPTALAPLDTLAKQEIIAITQKGFSQEISLTEMYRQLLTDEKYSFVRRQLVPCVLNHAQTGLLGDEAEAISGLANAVCQPRPLTNVEVDEHYDRLMTIFEARPGIEPGIFAAMRANPRKYFMPGFYSDFDATADSAMPIGYFQTISQPSLVASILQISGVKQGMKILEIGYGSGWLLSLLAGLVGETGIVYGAELVPQLAAWGKENTFKMSHTNVEFLDIGENNYPQNMPNDLDVVILSATVPDDESGLEYLSYIAGHLKLGSVIIYPRKNMLFLGVLDHGQALHCQPLAPVSFVPLVLRP